ncbi:MAG: hypothetical protein JO232_01605 [Verrucomicrobia bacterium]|nr:hypothetical protein [Verrucomicrobiota bacterium]
MESLNGDVPFQNAAEAEGWDVYTLAYRSMSAISVACAEMTHCITSGEACPLQGQEKFVKI